MQIHTCQQGGKKKKKGKEKKQADHFRDTKKEAITRFPQYLRERIDPATFLSVRKEGHGDQQS